MTWLDYAAGAVFVASVAWGAWRGLVREIVAILGWAIAFLAAGLLSSPLADRMQIFAQAPQFRVIVAYAAVFVSALVVTTVAGLVIAHLTQAVGLGGLDRTLGACFGILRGVVMLVAFALLAGLTTLPRQTVWTTSHTGPALVFAARLALPWLPYGLTQKISFDDSDGSDPGK